MATETKNYKFIKPDLTDDADIRVINQNFDKLDDVIFRVGEVANHIGDPNAHSDIFAKYLPLSGGTMTGSIVATDVTTNLGYTTFDKNVYMLGSNSLRFADDANFTIHNGYGKEYGAEITFTGNDYASYKNNLRLKSSESNTSFTQLRIEPSGVQITRGSSNTNEFDLKVPNVAITNLTAYNSGSSSSTDYFIKSYNGRCGIDFKEVNGQVNSQYIQIKVNDNLFKITNDGVSYNDKQFLFLDEYSVTTGDLTVKYGRGDAHYICQMEKYSTGQLVYAIKFYGNNPTDGGWPRFTFTFPVPFKNNNYSVTCTAVREDGSWEQQGAIGQLWRQTPTTIDSVRGGNCNMCVMARGEWK